ncbi:MAG: hypothetical protein Ct9H300mP7_4800 [Verrucomicrobiota bacterium]|nr:MAG: hypothetical protein Ct9H300mP7_4800 [Verrucomicrobiota bacterium]
MEKARDLLPGKGGHYVDDMDSVARAAIPLWWRRRGPEFKD